MIYTQQSLYEVLEKNPLRTEVYIGEGSLENKDYIFLDYVEEKEIPSDTPTYKTKIIINIYTKDIDDRKKLVDYMKPILKGSFIYTRDKEHSYFVATLSKFVYMYEQNDK
ncbi:MAG: hypothetical protein ACK5L6_07540 [Anaerorhabdus sp.]|uniref:hypothetical protein n=1 Tax=Anaerorhabdus sp. TaxID=1872524 RepID=UPI003A855E19